MCLERRGSEDHICRYFDPNNQLKVSVSSKFIQGAKTRRLIFAQVCEAALSALAERIDGQIDEVHCCLRQLIPGILYATLALGCAEMNVDTQLL